MDGTDAEVPAVTVGKYSRNRSIMAVTNNPFEAAAQMDGLHVEVLTDAVLLGDAEFTSEILSPLKETSTNEERITKLEVLKLPYLFSSSQLMELCQLTTSLKTRIEFIKLVGPRLMDPATKTSDFTSMFRFAEEKQQVEQVLKSRSSALGITQLTNTRRASSILSSRGGRGMGGRGGAGRGSDEAHPSSPSPSSSMASMFASVEDSASSVPAESGSGVSASSEVDSMTEKVQDCTIDA